MITDVVVLYLLFFYFIFFILVFGTGNEFEIFHRKLVLVFDYFC